MSIDDPTQDTETTDVVVATSGTDDGATDIVEDPDPPINDTEVSDQVVDPDDIADLAVGVDTDADWGSGQGSTVDASTEPSTDDPSWAQMAGGIDTGAGYGAGQAWTDEQMAGWPPEDDTADN